MLLFNFYFALLKVYCLFTLHVTAWGTRKGSDDSKNKEDSSIFQVYFPKIRDVSEQEINAIREKDDEQFKLFVKQNPPSITIVEPITVVSSTNNSPAMTPSSSLSSAITLGSSPVLPSPLGTTTTAALTAPSMAIEMESSNSSPKNSAPASSPQTGNYSRSPLSKTSYLANSGKNEMSLVNQKSSRPQTLLKPPHAESSNVLKPRPVAQQEAIKDRRTMSQLRVTSR